MAAKKSSEHRRKSIAAANQNKPPAQKSRRRPYSFVPGDRLSPTSKARRSLAPRKSILKASLNLPTPDDNQSELHPQTSIAEEGATSVDITRDFHTELHDNTSRKSIGRRVSFASHAQVRVFEIPEGTTNSTDSLQSSPTFASTDDEDKEPRIVDGSRHANDENAYPGSIAFNRRSSLRRSVGGGEESMDVDLNTTAKGPISFLRTSHTSGSAIQDEEDESFDGEMEMTEAIRESLFRRRSLAATAHRRPPSIIPPTTPSDPPQDESSYDQDADESQQSFTDDNSTTEHLGRPTREPLEYTIPLSKPLRPPAPPDELWLALRAMTHSGDTPYEPHNSSEDEGQGNDSGDGMNLGHAVERLMHAKSSLNSTQGADSDGNPYEEDSFSSLDNSYSNVDIGDQTMNISKIFPQVDVGDGDQTMNISRIFPKVDVGDRDELKPTTEANGVSDSVSEEPPPVPVAPTPPTHSQVEFTSAPTKPNVFHPPSSGVFQPVQSQANSPASTTNPPPDPILTKTIPQPASSPFQKSTSNAPVSPQKANPPTTRIPAPATMQKTTPTAAFMPPVSRPSPKKRPHSSNDGEDNAENSDDRPNPTKRTAMADKWAATVSSAVSPTVESSNTAKPKLLSPSKKALFQSPQPQAKPQSTVSSLRRPSGYFARRKSMGVEPSAVATKSNGRRSPLKKAGLGLGRASVGGGTLGLTDGFSGLRLKGKEKANKEPTSCKTEVGAREVAESSLPPGSPQITSLKEDSPAPTHSPQATITVDVSEILPPEERSRDDDTGNRDMNRVMNSTEQWRENLQQHDFAAADEGPPISIEQFFTMTGIRFMDEITVPRQSIYPSQLRPNSRTRRTSSGDAPEIPLAEYVIAMAVDVPQLKLYTRVSSDLEAWIAQSKVVFDQAEEEASKLTPQLFTEYSQANEEGQEQLLHQLQLMKANSRGLAKSEWYDWKLGWVEGLYATANKGFADLEADAKELEKINNRVTEILPALEEEHEQVMRELEQEQADVAEIENSDKDYLGELKSSIAEQKLEVDAMRVELAERKSQIEWLQERIAESESQKQEAVIAITQANRLNRIQLSSTRAEVFRLKDRLETLEALHMLHVTVVNANLFEFVCQSQFRVSLPCDQFKPRVEKVAICIVDLSRSKYKDAHPNLSDLLLRAARERIVHRKCLSTTQVAQILSDYWSSCSQLRSQLALLAVKYPVSVEIIPSGRLGFKAKAAVLFPTAKGKAVVSFVFDAKTYSRWPLTVGSVKCEVEIAYGPIDPERIYKAVAARLAEASAAENHACLLDACISAMEEYPS